MVLSSKSLGHQHGDIFVDHFMNLKLIQAFTSTMSFVSVRISSMIIGVKTAISVPNSIIIFFQKSGDVELNVVFVSPDEDSEADNNSLSELNYPFIEEENLLLKPGGQNRAANNKISTKSVSSSHDNQSLK